MDGFLKLVGQINTALWSNPMVYLCLGAGIFFTIVMKVPQIRMIPTMVRLLFNGKKSEEGLSSFQAFTLAIAGRVGTGNIAGVATAVAMGGPGALFWMWMTAIFGAATTFIECSMSQLHKKSVNGEYKGGWAFYIGDVSRAFGGVCAVIFILTLAFTQTGVHSNVVSSAIANAFGVPKVVGGILIAVLLAVIVIGGAKRIGRVAEIVVPFMSALYIVLALIVLVANASHIPAAFGMIFKGAFGADSMIGGAMGSAMIWGCKRAIFSSETGMATSTAPAASAEVSHPAKQGLVQAFSVYIDTLFICTATGLMLVVTGCFNVSDADGNILYLGLADAMEAGPTWVQAAMSTIVPFGAQFIAIATFFFGFTTCLNQVYSCTAYTAYFYQDSGKQPIWQNYVVYIIFIVSAVYGSMVGSAVVWDFGDTGLGIGVWINYIWLLGSTGVGIKLLKDFKEQQAQGLDPIFDPDKFEGQRGFRFNMDMWRSIRDRYKSGELKN